MLVIAIPQLIQAVPGHTWERIHPFSEDQRNVHYCLMSINMFIFLNFMYLNIILIILKKFWGKGVFKVSFFLNLLVLHTWLFKIKLVILIMRNNELNHTAPTYSSHTSHCSLSYIFFFAVFSFLFYFDLCSHFSPFPISSIINLSFLPYHSHHLIQSTFSSWI